MRSRWQTSSMERRRQKVMVGCGCCTPEEEVVRRSPRLYAGWGGYSQDSFCSLSLATLQDISKTSHHASQPTLKDILEPHHENEAGRSSGSGLFARSPAWSLDVQLRRIECILFAVFGREHAWIRWVSSRRWCCRKGGRIAMVLGGGDCRRVRLRVGFWARHQPSR